MLEAQNVSYAYKQGTPVLHDVSFSAERGQVVFLLGRNGCGKTTLMRCLSGVTTPGNGRVILNGINVGSLPPAERARRIGLIPQLHNPAFAYSVREVVLMGRAPHLGLFDSPRAADYAIANHALEQVGMGDEADRPYTQLSGGQRQMVMIARGLAQQCDVLLMDEPDAHLDPNNRHRVMEIVRALSANGMTFLISSHTPNHALAYADRVLLLHLGRRMAYGLPSETLTEALLSQAYDMPTEIIYQDGRPRAVVAREMTR